MITKGLEDQKTNQNLNLESFEFVKVVLDNLHSLEVETILDSEAHSSKLYFEEQNLGVKDSSEKYFGCWLLK